MSDLDRLHEIADVVRPPAFEELLETRRRRTRRARVATASSLAVAGIVAVGALIATGESVRTEPPPIAPSPSPTPAESFEIPAGQQMIVPDIGPTDVHGFDVLATVANTQPEHLGDIYLSITVTTHTRRDNGNYVVYYCRSHDVPTWIAYADGDLVGDGAGGAHDGWNFRECVPGEPTTLTPPDLHESSDFAEPRTVQLFAIAPPSAEMLACLATDDPAGCQELFPPIAATDAEFGFRIYEHPPVPPVLGVLEDPNRAGDVYQFEALSSIDGVAWLIDRGVVAAPGAARLAFEVPASDSDYLVDVYTVDGAHMQRCAEQHADELPDIEPWTPYQAALDKVCGVALRLVVDGNTVAPDEDPYANGHFTNLGAHLSPGAVHRVEVEVVHGDPRNIQYAVVVRTRTQMP